MITLQPGEIILMEVRKHWLMIVIHAFVLVVLALVPLLVAPVALQLMFADAISQLGNATLIAMYIFFGSAWLWFVWAMFFVMWTNYYLDVLVITNKRLIDMEQFVLFSRDEVTIPLSSVEDIKVETKGILATLFHFGNLQVQTAGAARETIATKIMRPSQVRSCLESAVEEQRKVV